MKRILFLANSGGGLFNFRKELVDRLILDGHEVHLSIPNDKWIEVFDSKGCICHPIALERRGKNPFKDIGLLICYKKLMREVRPHIVLTYTIKPNVYGGMACSLLHIPYVANITGLGIAVNNYGIIQKITLALYKCGLRKAQMVFFQNSGDCNFMLSQHVVKCAYGLLPGSGVNLKEHKLLDYPTTHTVDFIFVARIMREKGIDQYMDAAKYLKPCYPNIRFHICGACEQDYSRQVQRLNDNGTIIYHGLVDNIDEIYRISSCTVHPTFYPEGMSNVLLESCACGRPIITTDRPGCREVVEDGVNGFICKQKDSKDLIVQIKRFLALTWEQRRDMGLAGRAKVEKDFDRQIVIDAYLEETEKCR